ncbi:MAG: glycosyltransferase family 39 protein [Planctomycetota bacterium]
MGWFILSFWPVIPGYFAVCALWPTRTRLMAHFGLKCALGTILGLGGASLFYFATMALCGGLGREWLFALELLCGGLIIPYGLPRFQFACRPAEEIPDAPSQLGVILKIILFGGFFIGLGIQIYTAINLAQSLPQGYWDAWAAWNLKAKCFFLDTEHWTDSVSNGTLVPGADYPLLLPCLVARGWTYLGNISPLVPALLGYVYSFVSLALVFFGVRYLKSLSQAFIAGLFYLASPGVLHWGAAQYGDTPVGCYLLAMLVALSLYDAQIERKASLLLLAGVFGGLAVWTKHEGVLFVLAFGLARLGVVWIAEGFKTFARQMLFFMIGLLPSVSAMLILTVYAAQSGFFLQQKNTLANLLNFARYKEVFWNFINMLPRAHSNIFGSWTTNLLVVLLFYALLMGLKNRIPRAAQILWSLCATLLLIICGYGLIFVLTPMDLRGHLGTTSYRFLIQVYPSLFLAYFLMIATLEEGPLGVSGACLEDARNLPHTVSQHAHADASGGLTP